MTASDSTVDGPHQGQPVQQAGVAPEDAKAGVVLVHGRGATAASMLQFAQALQVEDVAFLAPQAARNTWYPNRFLAPIESNEPGLSSGLQVVGDTIERLVEAGIDRDHIVVGGFSQGACLASEFVARNPRRYGGVVALSGGLIGPEGTEFDYDGDLSGTPVFVGCDDSDPHIPLERVHETTAAFEALGGDVTERIYTGMGHTINEDERSFVADLVSSLTDD